MGNNYNTQTEKERKLEKGIKDGQKNKISTILAGLVGVGVVGVGALSGCLGGVDKDVGDDNMSKITYCTYNINETLETASETQQYLEEIIKECNGSEINIGEKTYTLKKLDNLSKTLKHKLTDLEQIEGDLNKYLKDNNLTNEYNESRLDSNDSRSYKIFDKVIERGYILADITDIIKGFGHINISQSYIKGTDYNAVSITSNKDISQLNNNVSQNYSGDTNNNTIYNISNNGTSNIISIEDLIKSGFNVTEKTWVGPNNKNITGYLVSFTDIKKGKKTIAYVKNDKKSILTFEQGYLVPTEPMLGFPDGIETKDKEGGNTLVFSPVIEEYGGIPPLTYCYSSGSCKTDPDKTPDKITLDNTEFGNETTGYQGPPDKNNVDINNSNREGGITLDNTGFGNETTGYQGPPDKNNVDINNSNREGGITL